MKNLVIVESPTKAKTIGRFLGPDYTIRASMGHIMDLPKSTLGVDLDNDFAPQFEVMVDKKKTITELKKLAKEAENIILATDPDREGEAIAAHVKEIILGKGKKTPIRRMVFHEITQEAIQEALNNPRDIDEHLVDAQIARRVLDRLVGYKLSPLLWQKVRRGLSAGRVQSIALRLIVEREKEIEAFKKEQYWTITALLAQAKIKQETLFELIEINNEKIEKQVSFSLYDGDYKVSKTTISTEDAAKKIVADVSGKPFVVADVVQKEMRRSPQAPYITSTLQQDASRRLGMNGKRTMMLAQKLYEEGFITYHRTDSVVMAVSAQTAIRSYIKKEFGDKYLPESPRFYTSKQKLAQEAHEAIRPTKVAVSGEQVTKELGAQFAKLYELIWRRAVASQMTDAITESTAVLADVKGTTDSYRFKATGSVLVFDGFLKINPQALQDTKLPQFTTGESLQLRTAQEVFHETPAPPRYNDASIIKTLEEKGIGRPSTYAAIISTIEGRRYIERVENRFVPTSVGVAVNDFLVKNFSEIDDIPFTAEMEDMLDDIAHGKRKWQPEIKKFYTPFEKQLVEVKKADRVKIEVEETDEACEKCKEGKLVIRMGRFGKFLSCNRFPDCDFKKAFLEETGFTCPKDEGKVIARKTRKGRVFFGCSHYPTCDFAVWKLEDLNDPAKLQAAEKQRVEKAKTKAQQEK